VKAPVGYPVVAGLAQVEDAQCRDQARLTRGLVNKHRELVAYVCVSSGRRWVHVQYTVPHLIEQILPKPPAPLDERVELHWLRVQHERWHPLKPTSRPA
jgi:hypothetical protein